MSRRTAKWLAWSLWTFFVLLAALAWLFTSSNAPSNLLIEGFHTLAFLSFPTVGALIASRRPENPVGWIFCAVGLGIVANFAQEYAMYTLVTRPGILPGGVATAWLGSWLGNLAFYLTFTFPLLLFPSGRLLSRRWRPVAWLSAGVIVLNTLGVAFDPGPIDERIPSVTNPFAIESVAAFRGAADLVTWFGFLLAIVASAASLVLRFRHATGEERQQLKWLAYTAAFMIVLVVVLSASDRFVSQDTTLDTVLDAVGFTLLVVAMPAASGIAILKYRLYDIDVIIRRTLVYSTLTTMLALVYFSSVVLLQQLFRSVTGSISQLAVVCSTLVIAALFQPLRHRIQQFIDRRFYRRKYDLTKTVQAFSATIRDEVELTRLSNDLVAVVEETMQPAHVSLWLRDVPRT